MQDRKTILVVDDESDVREIVHQYLEKEGFRVIEAHTGPLALQKIYEEQPDLVVLDVMLPGLDGLTVTRSIRSPIAGSNNPTKIPIIMLTARTDEQDRIAGFELGADDYVVKLFSPRELVMRVKAVLRRSAGAGDSVPPQSPSNETLTYEDLRLDLASRTVKKGARDVSLTAKEFELLRYLVRNPHRVYTRSQLLDQVWGYDYYGDDSTVTVHIHRLREKIETDPTQPELIHTVWGVGYKFGVL